MALTEHVTQLPPPTSHFCPPTRRCRPPPTSQSPLLPLVATSRSYSFWPLQPPRSPTAAGACYFTNDRRCFFMLDRLHLACS
ncbi:hypothetical protein L2E82_20560 [Cichorium intybus]|uniref:Uncharacterized protein n=1 Tax=Cichorium intybus TaxID=13427 RepID=A0ACB9DTD0_CICIN|nr:hypothetical protein L2E82_20560 [Cichorium intybus]